MEASGRLKSGCGVGAGGCIWGSMRGMGKFWFWGLGGGLGAILTLDFNNRVARKLRRTSMLHLGQITFSFFRILENTSFSCFSDVAGVSMTAETNYY